MKAHRRHCERSEAIQSKNARLLYCFASLAMTAARLSLNMLQERFLGGNAGIAGQF
jgi:hypothetical protein